MVGVPANYDNEKIDKEKIVRRILELITEIVKVHKRNFRNEPSELLTNFIRNGFL